MNKSNRYVFGVIAAQLSDIQQTEILQGMIRQAQTLNIDLAVISNIYNPIESTDILENENDIYDLIVSDELDGFILISESIINPGLHKRIIEHLKTAAEKPIVVIGTPQPGFVLDNFHFINTSDENDFSEITSHLIEKHGFTDIDILTGHDYIEASHLRVRGYKKALEKHNIHFDNENVHFGNYWMNTGQELAQKYYCGELRLPQAVICANDYMAYGMLDEFTKCGIRVPDDITVIGYEYVRERIYHSPILTTYQRNRVDLGTQAVRLLDEKLISGKFPEFTAPDGCLIKGDSCSCGHDISELNSEQNSISLKRTFDFLNLFGQIELRFTECRTMRDFILICREFRYMLFYTEDVWLCLYDDWYEEKSISDNMIVYKIFSDEAPVTTNKNNFTKLFSGPSAVYNFSPLFFFNRSLGYAVTKYHSADANTPLFRHWLKAISNGLEFLRMKNDLQYITQCCNLSDTHDTVTDMNNERGFREAFDLSSGRNNGNSLYFAVLKVCLFDKGFSRKSNEKRISSVLAAADAVKSLCGSENICGRINDNTFVCLISNTKISDSSMISDMLRAIIIGKKTYLENFDIDSFVCAASECKPGSTYENIFSGTSQKAEKMIKDISDRHIIAQYKEMLKIRNCFYSHPEKYADSDKTETSDSYSPGHLRNLYKKCFDVNPHQDSISSRVQMAKYFLYCSNDSMQEIAACCGYQDDKYFLRQFHKNTGFTPKQYRAMFHS